MPVVFNDPTVWPVVSSYRISSYFVVAASVGVTYDWGEHDKITELLMSYKDFQRLHSDKRPN